MPSRTLKRLARNELADRSAKAAVPVTMTYSPTPLGASLALIVEGLGFWSTSGTKCPEKINLQPCWTSSNLVGSISGDEVRKYSIQ